MNERSYLDTLNAERERKPSTTLEQITQSLQNLESRLGRSRDVLDEIGRDRQPQWQQPPYDAAPRREREVPRSFAPKLPSRTSDTKSPYQSLARDYDRVLGQEEGIASASRIASELTCMREELRQQMASDINREFEVLRAELSRMLASSNSAPLNSGLTAEIDRISSAIHNLSERTDDRSLNALREEIEQVKGTLDSLAREETVRSSGRSWDDFDRRWSAFEHRVDARQNVLDSEIAILSERLQSISEALRKLPESLSLRSIEENLRTLASAIEHLVLHQEHQAPETFRLIDQRLDEISRAIVASSVSNAPILDPEPFQRIEARISSLARQIDELVEDRPTAQVIDHIVALTHRVEELAAQGGLPEEAIERLSRQVHSIAEKIEQTPFDSERDAIVRDMNHRFDVLSAMIELSQGNALELGNTTFRDLERRLDGVASRIDQRASALDAQRLIDVIDARFADLTEHISSASPDTGSNAMRQLEDRLESISMRIDASALNFAGMDSGLIRSLESQVAALSEHLSRPVAPLPELEDIGPRLNDLERAISGSRDAIVQAARQAAEEAVRSLDGAKSDPAAITDLTQDLKALEELTRRSGERNNKTFEAIHDTLIKIVDRLGSMDPANTLPALPKAAGTPPVARVMEPEDTPPLQGDADDFHFPPAANASPRQSTSAVTAQRMPADTALAAMGSDVVEQRTAAAKTTSFLGGVSRALGLNQPVAENDPSSPTFGPVLAGNATPEPSLDEPLDPKLANRPPEIGSGAPDLNAIMRRVREERNQTASAAPTDAARQDFLAAARRHAQAAAAEAAIANRPAEKTKPALETGFGSILKRYRKRMLMAVTGLVVVLAGLKIGQMSLSGDDQVANTTQPLFASKVGDGAATESQARPAEQVPMVATGAMLDSDFQRTDPLVRY